MGGLVVFVHGLGADPEDWWGTTPTAVESHPELKEDRVVFWGYETSQAGIGWTRWLGQKLRLGRTRQTIRQMGDHLWDDIKALHIEEDFSSVRLVGHSMGGLVVAAALGRAHEDPYDTQLLDAVGRVVLIASPLAGAIRATGLAEIVAKTTGGNIHLRDLKPDSKSRKEIVTRFIHRVIDGGLKPVIFRAGGDAVVLEPELTGPLQAGTYEGPRVLDGGHSDCVQDLNATDQNLIKIMQALRMDSHDAPPQAGLAAGDELIGKVEVALANSDLTESERWSELRRLFVREAFEGRNSEDGWAEFFYVIAVTRIVLRSHATDFKDPEMQSKIRTIANALKTVQDEIASAFARPFSATTHIEKYRKTKADFVSRLPAFRPDVAWEDLIPAVNDLVQDAVEQVGM